MSWEQAAAAGGSALTLYLGGVWLLRRWINAQRVEADEEPTLVPIEPVEDALNTYVAAADAALVQAKLDAFKLTQLGTFARLRAFSNTLPPKAATTDPLDRAREAGALEGETVILTAVLELLNATPEMVNMQGIPLPADPPPSVTSEPPAEVDPFALTDTAFARTREGNPCKHKNLREAGSAGWVCLDCSTALPFPEGALCKHTNVQGDGAGSWGCLDCGAFVPREVAPVPAVGCPVCGVTAALKLTADGTKCHACGWSNAPSPPYKPCTACRTRTRGRTAGGVPRCHRCAS